MKVYLACVTHKQGVNLYAGSSKEELLGKLADYCRSHGPDDWCGSVLPSQERINAMTDLEVVEAYFQDHPSEFVDEDSDEIADQIWYVSPGNPKPSRTPDFDDSYRPKGEAITSNRPQEVSR